jgi:phage baseplate assembly protein W
MKAISIPFRFDGYGNIASSTSPDRVWAGRVRSVIGTPMGSRVMRSDFGSDIPNNLFDVVLSAPGLVEASISSAASRWLPDLSIVDIDVTDEDTNDVSISITYEIPESQVSGQTFSVRIF